MPTIERNTVDAGIEKLMSMLAGEAQRNPANLPYFVDLPELSAVMED